MEQILKLLEILSDMRVHSGVELGKLLGISRSGIWKIVQNANQHLGTDIQAISAKGYTLGLAIDWLSAPVVYANFQKLETSTRIASITTLKSVSSTNDIALAAAASGAEKGAVWLAEHQAAGRGRRGRVWISPLIGNVYASLLWRFDGGVAILEGLSLVIGVAIAEALKNFGLEKVLVKWPNDILLDSKKLGGVLIEIGGDPLDNCYVVIGIGINTAITQCLERQATQPIVSTMEYIPPTSRNRLIAHILESVSEALVMFESAGFRMFVDRWRQVDSLMGKEVFIYGTNDVISGMCRGVTERGALIIETVRGREEINAGEVTVRQI